MTELKALIMLGDCDFVCKIQYAFQDDSQLYMVLELAYRGDMRYNLRATSQSRFQELTAKDFVCQILLALECCHKSSILHRG